MSVIPVSGEVIAIIAVVLIALLGLAVGYGALQQRVKNNKDNIEKLCEDNRGDHKGIYDRLDKINGQLSKIDGKLNNGGRYRQ